MNPGFSNFAEPFWVALLLIGFSAVVPCHAGESYEPDVSLVGRSTVAVDEAKFARVYFVSPSVSSADGADGSRERPWPSIIVALSEIPKPATDSSVAVFVAEGVYKADTILMREQVDLYGGFDARSWERDIFSHPTVLDGGSERRILVGANEARLDGFIIQNGRSPGPGGGLLCDGTSPAVTNNLFRKNHTVEPVGFRHDLIHQDGNRGGAVACLYNAVPRIANNVFSGNWTEVGDGAGVAVYGWVRLDDNPRTIIENNVFTDNISGTRDQARTRSSSGGAIACSHEASPVLRNNVIVGNRAQGNSDAGGIYCEYFSSPLIEANWIVGNACDDDGGGFYTMRLGEPLLRRNLIVGNWAESGGVGGVRVSKEGRVLMERNVVAHNQSGGGVLSVDGYAVIRGNLIAHNRGGPGIGYRQQHDYFKSSRFKKNRLWGNDEGPFEIKGESGDPPKFEGNRTVPDLPVSVTEDGDSNRSMLIPGGSVERADYDAEQAIWRIGFQIEGSLYESLSGRVVRIGEFWGVVRSAENGIMNLWAVSSAEFHIGAGIEILSPPSL